MKLSRCDRVRAGAGAFALLAGIALGCGGDDSPSKRAEHAHEESEAAGPRLAKPVHPRCGVETFAPAQVKRTATGWQLVYRFPPRAPVPAKHGQTTVVTLVEESPRRPRGRVTTGRERVIAGRKVSFADKTATTLYVAKWKTKRALYIALADGATPRVLERVIACSP